MLKRLRPGLNIAIPLTIGLIMGFVWAYLIAPVVWRDAAPSQLQTSYQDLWVKAAVEQYNTTGDAVNLQSLLNAVNDPIGRLNAYRSQVQAIDPGLAGRIDRALQASAVVTGTPPPSAGFFQGDLMPFLCIIFTMMLGIGFGLAMVFFGMGPMPAMPTGPAVGASAESRLGGIKEAKRIAEERADIYQESDLGPPASQFMSTYLMGDDLYDDSFSVELSDGSFLGECGSGISKTIGVGDPKRVTAAEVWLFDKNDIRTVTKVLMSEHAFNDEAIRAELASKGEAVLARRGEVVAELRTQTLRVQVTVVDMEYGEGALPPNSFFERLTVELAAWQVESGEPLADPYSSDTMATDINF